MEQTEQQDLFETKLNASGKHYIRKFIAAARLVIVTGIIISLIYITITVIRTIKIDPVIYGGNKILLFQHRIWPFYIAMYSTLFFLQLFYFRKIGNCLRKGMDYSDGRVFNESFNALYRYAAIGAVLSVLVLLMGVMDLYWMVSHYLY